MNLPDLIIKHNLKSGDDVVCTVVTPGLFYGLGVKTLTELNGRLGFYAARYFSIGNLGSFELPRPANNFQCKNTATLKPKSEKQIEIECIECEIEKLMDKLNNLKGSE